MRLRHIEIFQAIRQTGSISAAAQLLHVSQPAVSKVLQHAELQLGFPLFLRIRGKLQPTPEALALEREVDKVTESLQGVRRLAQNLRREPGQSLRIGATPALALSLLPPAIREWTQRYPDIACELSSAHSRELVQNLLMREVDVALTLQPPDHPGLNAQPLAHGVLVALAPQGYWKENELGKPLPLMALAGAPLIGLSSADPLSAKLDSYLEAVDPPPRVSIAVQTYSLARAMVESGAGLAVIDPFTALGASPATTCIRPLAPPLPITLYALTRADEPPPHMLASLLEIFGSRAHEQLDRL
ncbi:LysR family transcriptional regulator [Pseudomonas sp. 21615526]|jgi:DNA-binding transcriptional LysR family regulator|uniref:LysR family transcriptional regulator n=1 Tax=unclassified Pseudomonas TaxID=196821 RepID=UPI00159FE85C|nr:MULTISPECIES: LysR substrate-binding domain-containing protein [unclassified Pseudomonas]NVZ37836.1 LysR family transcriptional regulator [Pseudomonas sp. 21615526]NWB40086.1 LysR family transcriptional regulator [Pseudomonas sp. E6002]NWB65709.1 LysR family transcriptional regulator [Pseudomonas sp. I8001]NWC68791.1 LysR family transcriptional regulator [Pseudomonas sp. P7758]